MPQERGDAPPPPRPHPVMRTLLAAGPAARAVSTPPDPPVGQEAEQDERRPEDQHYDVSDIPRSA